MNNVTSGCIYECVRASAGLKLMTSHLYAHNCYLYKVGYGNVLPSDVQRGGHNNKYISRTQHVATHFVVGLCTISNTGISWFIIYTFS